MEFESELYYNQSLYYGIFFLSYLETVKVGFYEKCIGGFLIPINMGE